MDLAWKDIAASKIIEAEWLRLVRLLDMVLTVIGYAFGYQVVI